MIDIQNQKDSRNIDIKKVGVKNIKYPIIVMDAFEQAAEMLEAIKAELEANPRIASDFPEACGQGRVWRAGVIVTANGRKVEAFGSSKKIRGRRHGAAWAYRGL